MCPSTLLTLMAKSRSSMTSLSPLLLFIFPVFFFFILFFPPCQVRVVRFYVSCPPPSSLLLLLVLLLAGPHLPALDRSGPRRISSASSWLQWASPDLNCQLSIAVGLAGPQPARARSLWASPDLNRRESLWASPDLNWQDSEHCGPRHTSTGEILRALGLADLNRTSTGPQPDLNRTSTARNNAGDNRDSFSHYYVPNIRIKDFNV